MNVPVDQLVKLQFNAPAKVDILEDLSVPLKADIKTSIPLKSAMQVPVRSRLRASATILEPADALIAEMDLKLPLREVGLSFSDGDSVTGSEEYETASTTEEQP